MFTKCKVSLVPRPCPAFRRYQSVLKATESWVVPGNEASVKQGAEMPTTKTFVKVKLYVVSLWMHSLVAWAGLTSRTVPVLMWLVLCGQCHETRSGMVCAR